MGTDAEAYEVEVPNGGFLVRSVAFRPGWKALADGAEVPVLRGNYLFQAVPIPPGIRVVEFRYEPEAFRLGLLLSLWSGLIAAAASAGALLAAWIHPPWKDRVRDH